MIQDLGEQITTQFKGEITGIQRHGHLFIGGQRIRANHHICAKSIVIVEAPPIFQGEWLAARVAKLLIPQIQQETGGWCSIICKYCGLVQVHKIEVVTSPWNLAVLN